MNTDICPWCKDPRGGSLHPVSVTISGDIGEGGGWGRQTISVWMHEKCTRALWARIKAHVGVKEG